MYLGVPKIVTGYSVNDQPNLSVQYCVGDPNTPWSYFLCITLLNSNDGAQIGVGSDNGLYFRFKSNGEWGTWGKAALV